MINLRLTTDSIQGRERLENKDKVWIATADKYVFAVLFDGVSSAKNALEGIDIAIESIKQNFHQLMSPSYSVSDLMFGAHLKMRDSGLDSPFSTFSAICIYENGNIVFSNMGDSRIYEVNPQYLKQLSADDNLINNKSVVTKCLGMLELERSDFKEYSGELNDNRILLCSDGFYSILENNLARFYKILTFKNESNVKKSLFDEISGKNSDDASYVLIFK